MAIATLNGRGCNGGVATFSLPSSRAQGHPPACTSGVNPAGWTCPVATCGLDSRGRAQNPFVCTPVAHCHEQLRGPSGRARTPTEANVRVGGTKAASGPATRVDARSRQGAVATPVGRASTGGGAPAVSRPTLAAACHARVTVSSACTVDD